MYGGAIWHNLLLLEHVFLSVGAYLGACTCADVVFNLLPIFSVETVSFLEAILLGLGPTAFGLRLFGWRLGASFSAQLVGFRVTGLGDLDLVGRGSRH